MFDSIYNWFRRQPRECKIFGKSVIQNSPEYTNLLSDIILFTYRTEFPEITLDSSRKGSFSYDREYEPTGYNTKLLSKNSDSDSSETNLGTDIFSDYTWGCMWRSGQMLFARILKLFSGTKYDPKFLLSHFLDYPYCPYSIHKLTAFASLNKLGEPGKWIGPHSMALLLKQFINQKTKLRMGVYIPNENIIYEDQIDKVFNKFGVPTPIVIFIRLRLGETLIKEKYFEPIKALLEHETSLGILGGTFNRGYYIVGYVENYMLGADPHTLNVTPQMTDHVDNYIIEYKCSYLTQLAFNRLDSSLTMCCYFKDKDQYTNWKNYTLSKKVSSTKDYSTVDPNVEDNSLFYFEESEKILKNNFSQDMAINNFNNVVVREI